MGAEDGRMPWEDLSALQRELECYQPNLSNRQSLILANKMDHGEAERNLKRLRQKTELEICPIIAVLGDNIETALQLLRENLVNYAGDDQISNCTHLHCIRSHR
jgi:GTPase involved in cell partitioning and DNA repair